MLYQLHWQFKDGKTEMRTQFEIDGTMPDFKKRVYISAELSRAKRKHPLPKSAIWMLCNEKSEDFVGTTP